MHVRKRGAQLNNAFMGLGERKKKGRMTTTSFTSRAFGGRIPRWGLGGRSKHWTKPEKRRADVWLLGERNISSERVGEVRPRALWDEHEWVRLFAQVGPKRFILLRDKSSWMKENERQTNCGAPTEQNLAGETCTSLASRRRDSAFIFGWHQGKSPARTCLWHYTRSSELCSLTLMLLIEGNRKRVRRGACVCAHTADSGGLSRTHLEDDARNQCFDKTKYGPLWKQRLWLN